MVLCLSGLPQGLVLRSLLVIIYINDIDEGLTNRILKIANDTNLFGVVTNGDDVEKMRTDLGRQCDWSKEWLMLFNPLAVVGQ